MVISNLFRLKDFGGGRSRARTADLLLVSYPNPLLALLPLPGISTTWGVCFRSADIL
jgi:hypothetical protein